MEKRQGFRVQNTKYADLVTRTTHAVLETPGAVSGAVRWAVMHDRRDEIPAAVAGYVAKVRQHAWKVTDEDVAALERAGYSEDAIFELTVSAAVGAALQRLERGLIALHESRS